MSAEVALRRRSWRRLLGGCAALAVAGALASGAAAEEFRDGVHAFTYLHKVAMHARCMNCHGRDLGTGRSAPLVGDGMEPHPMNVTAALNPPQPAMVGTAQPVALGITCGSCHGARNAELPGGPPGAPLHVARKECTAQEHPWRMPAATHIRLWPGMTPRTLCEIWRARHENPDPKAFERAFLGHVGCDPLVEWAFSPGEGRIAAPGSHQDFIAAATVWTRSLVANDTCDGLRDD